MDPRDDDRFASEHPPGRARARCYHPAMRTRCSLILLTVIGLAGCFEDPAPVDDDSGNDDSGTTGAATDSTGTPPDDSTGMADSSGESTGAVDACPEYCGLVQDICTDDLQQYQGEDICLAVCAALPPGEAGDQLGNSAACRRSQAIQAAEAPGTFCGPAGPTGDDTCGASCESFCGLATALCVDDMAQWPDVPSCIADCMQFPNDVEYNSMVVSGDSYACRMYHLTVAALDPAVHCPHIGLDSPVCL